MKQEEMNTQLYEKLAAEQTKYRDWLMGQPPEEILNHAYEYAVREDILAAAELMDIPQAQAAALLAVPSPMEAIYVLANTVRHKEHDGRISRDNKTWARTIPIYEDPDAWGNDRNVEFVVDGHNPGLVDLFINAARHEYLLTQPLTKDDIRAEAARILSAFQAAREPNSPSGTHFMVQVSPDFLARANSKNQNRLVSMLPFRSLSISTLEGRKGVYVLITKDEDRAQSLRLRKPSVRKKLSETKAEPGHTDKKKVREQER